jgi:hypothetical protein
MIFVRSQGRARTGGRPGRYSWPKARWHWLFAALLLLLAGCGTKQVVVEGNFPQPLVSKYPLTVGVWYDPAFREHEFFDEAKGRTDSDWLVRTGEAQVDMWDTLLRGLFARVVHLEYPPGEGEPPPVDVVLAPEVDELQYAIPTQTNIKVYEIWMRYNLALRQPDGAPIADWQMTAYGKTPTAFLQSDEAAVNLAAVMALRDAGANFITSFPAVPDVALWLEDTLQPAANTVRSAPPGTDTEGRRAAATERLASTANREETP